MELLDAAPHEVKPEERKNNFSLKETLRELYLRLPSLPVYSTGISQGESQPTPLTYFKINKAVRTMVRALESDPASAYIYDPSKSMITHATFRAIFLQFVKSEIAFQVSNADSICLCTWAPNDPNRSPDFIDSIINKVQQIVNSIANRADTEEFYKRKEEMKSKGDAALKETIGASRGEMMYIKLIATDPLYQGRGYGSQLIEYINGIADSSGRSVCLFSSNVINKEFYNSHGYYSVRDFALGDDNPNWDKPPVVISLMVRKHSQMGGKVCPTSEKCPYGSHHAI